MGLYLALVQLVSSPVVPLHRVQQPVGGADVHAAAPQVVPDGSFHHPGGAHEVDGEGVDELPPRPLRPGRDVAVDLVSQAPQRPRGVGGDEPRVGRQLCHERPREAPDVLLRHDVGRVPRQLLGRLRVAPELAHGGPQLARRGQHVLLVVSHDEAPARRPDVLEARAPALAVVPVRHQLAQLRLQQVHQLEVYLVVLAEARREVLHVQDDDFVGVAHEGLDVGQHPVQRLHAHDAVVGPPLLVLA